MSNGILSKIGRALSIFGVSNPDDIRRMQARKTSPNPAQPAPPEAAVTPAGEGGSKDKEMKEE